MAKIECPDCKAEIEVIDWASHKMTHIARHIQKRMEFDHNEPSSSES